MRITIAALMCMGLCLGSVAQADGIVNGDFEDTALVHPEWEVTTCDLGAVASVVIDPFTGCSYARITNLSTDTCEKVQLHQDGLRFCENRGDYATIQFDVRTATTLPQTISVNFGGVIREIIPTKNTWAQHRVSVDLRNQSSPTFVTFTVYNQDQGECVDLASHTLDIDNVFCFESAVDLTTLCDEAMEICACTTCGTSTSLTGAGAGCPPVYTRCVGDLDGDCIVGQADLNIVLAHFNNECEKPSDCFPGDVNGDCVVDFDDMLAVLGAWDDCSYGPCNPSGCP